MTSEDKEKLLFKDLCARLPYGIKASYYGVEEECETWDEIECITLNGYVDIGQYSLTIESIKPYLFPLSSMTNEQKKELKYLCDWENDRWRGLVVIQEGEFCMNTEIIDWLNKNHFDYNRLIEKGLAIDATDLNIY